MHFKQLCAVTLLLVSCEGWWSFTLAAESASAASSTAASATAHFAQGHKLLQAGDPDGAVIEFKAGLKDAPNNAVAWFYLGEARLKLGSLDLARDSYKKSLELEPFGSVSDKASDRLKGLDSDSTGNASAARKSGSSVPAPEVGEPGSWIADGHGCKAHGLGGWDTMSWSGTCVGGYVSGTGTMILTTKSSASGTVTLTGTWLKGRQDERYPITMDQSSNGVGVHFEGTAKDGAPEGNGSLAWSNGQKYTGEFHNGAFNGTGTMISPNGNTFVGEWKNGSPLNGRGVTTENGQLVPVSVANGQFVPQSPPAPQGQALAQSSGVSQEQKDRTLALCRQACEVQQNQCTQQADSASAQAITNAVASVLGHGSAVGAVEQGQDSDNMRSACSSNNDLCLAKCQ